MARTIRACLVALILGASLIAAAYVLAGRYSLGPYGLSRLDRLTGDIMLCDNDGCRRQATPR